MSANQSGSTNSMSIWDQLHEQTLKEIGAKLSPVAVKRIWNEGAAFIERKADAKAKIAALRTTLKEQERARPHELALKHLTIALDGATPASTSSISSKMERKVWDSATKIIADLSQQYMEISTNWHTSPVPESELPLPKREVVRLLREAGWKGDVSAFLSQASTNPAIKACKSNAGRGWHVGKLYDLGIRLGKLEPKATRNQCTLESVRWFGN